MVAVKRILAGLGAAMLGLAVAVPAASAWNLRSLSFVDESCGWAVGVRSDPARYGLLATADSGATWHVVKSSEAFNGTGLDVQFVSHSRGVWVNSYVYSTLSGGSNWRRWGISSWYGTLVDYATPSVVWVAGTYGSDGGGRCVARSTNGGRTWRTCLKQNQRLGSLVSGLSAPSATTAYVWSRGLMVTRNSGRTWSMVRTDRSFRLDAWWEADFPSTTTGWLLRYRTATLLRTLDGGRHWSKQMPGLEQRLTDMDFISPDVGWVVGAAGAVYRTEDGGANWVYQDTGAGDELSSVEFVDAKHGWVTTTGAWGMRNSVYRTVDGGATWQKAL